VNAQTTIKPEAGDGLLQQRQSKRSAENGRQDRAMDNTGYRSGSARVKAFSVRERVTQAQEPGKIPPGFFCFM
jgi:hypothetical protein